MFSAEGYEETNRLSKRGGGGGCGGGGGGGGGGVGGGGGGGGGGGVFVTGGSPLLGRRKEISHTTLGGRKIKGSATAILPAPVKTGAPPGGPRGSLSPDKNLKNTSNREKSEFWENALGWKKRPIFVPSPQKKALEWRLIRRDSYPSKIGSGEGASLTNSGEQKVRFELSPSSKKEKVTKRVKDDNHCLF